MYSDRSIGYWLPLYRSYCLYITEYRPSLGFNLPDLLSIFAKKSLLYSLSENMFSRRSKHIRVAACCTLGSAVIFWLADLQWILPHQFSTAPSSSWKSGSNVNKNYSQAIEDNNISSNFIINENNNNNNLVKENNNENNLINSDSNSHTIIIDHEDCNGKQSLLAILQRAGKTDLSPATCRELPLWSEVVDLYGNEPIIFGLETCQQYRDIVALNGSEPDPRVAGMFNTGTFRCFRSEALTLAIPFDGSISDHLVDKTCDPLHETKIVSYP